MIYHIGYYMFQDKLSFIPLLMNGLQRNEEIQDHPENRIGTPLRKV